jgi:hypothetical protein
MRLSKHFRDYRRARERGRGRLTRRLNFHVTANAFRPVSSSLLSGSICCFTVSYLIAPVYGWFTEGFDTPDLNKTKALLEALDA